MNHRVKILGFLVVSFFAILLLVTSFTQKNNIKYKGVDMLDMVLSSDYVLDSAGLEKLSQYLVVDLREPEQILLDPIAGAVNIPVSELLEKDNQSIFKRANPKVFVAYDPMLSNEAWMLMRQLGYDNMYVMELKEPDRISEYPESLSGVEVPVGDDH